MCELPHKEKTEEIEIDDEQTWESLAEEAKIHINDLNRLREDMDDKQQKRAEKIIKGLQKALANENEDRLQDYIEDAIDFMIDLKL